VTSTSHTVVLTRRPIGIQAPPLDAVDAGITRIEVFLSLAEARRDWHELAAVAVASPYQAFIFAEAWFGTIGAASGAEPFIAVARDVSGAPTALLPLARRRLGPLFVASFAGGKHSNFNLGLFRPGRLWSAAELGSLLTGAARATPSRIDCFALLNQPRSWHGVRNPFIALGGKPSPSCGYKSELPLSFAAWRDARVSKSSKKKLRRAAERLEALGPVAYSVARDETHAEHLLSAFVAQKRQRARRGGHQSPYEDTAAQAFLRRLATDGLADGRAPIELHALMLGERAVAVFGALPGRDRLSGLVLAHERDPDIARCAPGRLLLQEVVRSTIERGFETFDLGVGEAPYKSACCEAVEPLFDTFFATSALGEAAAIALRLQRRAKGLIKRSPILMSAATRLQTPLR
jgi:CelD/BcsL family acetyltransferase involved in cellulose biosynthesis